MGVIASADRIVSPAYINAHSDDLLVPGSRVLAVVKLPFGAHPSPCRGIAPHLGYAEDDQFLLNFRAASKDLTRLDAWSRQWVLTVNHAQYIAQLGAGRLRALTRRAAPDAWLRETRRRLKELNFGAPPTPTEQMVVAMAQICAERIRARGYRTILAGQGTSNLAAWLAYYLLAKEGRDVDLMAEIGLYGYAPRPPQPLIFNFANIATCKGVGSALDVLGIHVTGSQRESCIGLLGAGLIDEYGNVDSTCIPDLKMWLLGSGGANDVLSGAAEVIICCLQDIRRLWRQVPYVTGPGDRVTTLVTTKGVFRRAGPSEPFRLEAVLPPIDAPSQPLDVIVQEIRQRTGWDVHTAPTITRLAPPDRETLQLLRLFDPDRHYLS
jgi:acyl CoA:acetate/3-ketoacid CoA transferase beta subunit